MFLLIGEVGVGRARPFKSCFSVAGSISPWRIGLDDGEGVGNGRTVGCERVRRFEREVRQHLAQLLVEPAFFVGVPRSRHVPCGQPTRLARQAQAVCALIAQGAIDGVAAFPRVGYVSEESRTACVGVAQTIIVVAAFLHFLEVLVSPVGLFTQVVLQAIALKPGVVPSVRVRFHAGVGVQDVVFVEHVVVAYRCTEVPAEHAVVCARDDTAIGHHAKG